MVFHYANLDNHKYDTCNLIKASEIFNNWPPYLNAMIVFSYDFQKEINFKILQLFNNLQTFQLRNLMDIFCSTSVLSNALQNSSKEII